MLSNSEFVVMLNQAYSDRAKLSKLLNISDEQMSYITNADGIYLSYSRKGMTTFAVFLFTIF